jgi:acyl-CoA synthetase (AMP-forming)/AMP-acid ligase II
VAGTTAAAMYLDGKYAVRKDLREIQRILKIIKLYTTAGEFFPRVCNYLQQTHIFDIVVTNRQALYYFFEESVNRRPNDDCIWSREGCFTWAQAYERANQWAQWFLQQGVKPHDYVAFYLTNSPDFVLAWLGLWAIGAAPAMINHNLAGNALIHCLKVPKASLLLADEDPVLRARIDEEKGAIEGELGMNIVVLDEQVRKDVRNQEAKRPEDALRDGIKGDWPMAMFYTRFVSCTPVYSMTILTKNSGTTGLPKGCPYNIDRGFQGGCSV